jgi:hypothetical protein
MAGVAKATASAASPAAVVKALKVRVAITAPNDVKDLVSGYLKMSVIADGSCASGLSQPTSKNFSQFLAHGRP